MSKCIIDHDYAVVYELEILPQNPQNLTKEHEAQVKKGSYYDESGKWFNDELEIGKNRPLMNDFIQMAQQNEKKDTNICFLISLNKLGESKKPFQLKLLKSGTLLMQDFRAPQKIWDMKTIDNGVDYVEMQVHFDTTGLPTDGKFKYELWTTYYRLKNDVSIMGILI